MSEIAGHLTTLEAAARLKVSRARIDQFCREERLEFIWVGNARLISEASVEEFAKQDRPAHRPKVKVDPKPKLKGKKGKKS
jgi:excisionase family DNA binding protein